MKPLWLKLIPLVFALLLASGCTVNVPALASITITLTDVRNEGGQTIATMRYLNESVLSIGLSETEHKVYLNGQLVGEAKITKALGLAPTMPVVENVTLKLSGPAPVAGPAQYRLENRLTVLVGDSRVTSKSQSSGSVTVR